MQRDEGLLAVYRGFDLTDQKGLLCGRLLGDLGADIIKIERPGGDAARNIGPFYHDDSHPEKSLFWFAYNANKRGITLNLESHDGREIFKRLVRTADFVLESFAPGYMNELGLGYSALAEINSQIIMTSITPFGQTGPYAAYKSCDLIAMALGGLAYLVGNPDRAPLRVGYPQSHLFAGVYGAVGTLIALHHRQMTGEGQHVDVSEQASLLPCDSGAPFIWDINRRIAKRVGSRAGIRTMGLGGSETIFPCKDGYVTFVLYGGQTGAKSNRAMVELLDEKGMAPDFLKEMDWPAFDMATVSQEELDRITSYFGKYFQGLTKSEFYEKARGKRMMGCPVNSANDVLEDPQLTARDFWEDVGHPELCANIRYPGAFAKLSQSACGIRRRAPFIGEHNAEIYVQELGMSQENMVSLKQAGVI